MVCSLPVLFLSPRVTGTQQKQNSHACHERQPTVLLQGAQGGGVAVTQWDAEQGDVLAVLLSLLAYAESGVAQCSREAQLLPVVLLVQQQIEH
jgi:hypothetical protein